MPFNVGAALELPKVKDTLSERILTEAEAHRIMNAPKNPRDRALISVLYAGALRREVAVRLKWRDLKDRDDLGAGVGQATLFGKGSKTGIALLPASVYSQLLALRSVTERTPEGENVGRDAGEDEAVFRSRKRKNGRDGHLDPHLFRVTPHAAFSTAGRKPRTGCGRTVTLWWPTLLPEGLPGGTAMSSPLDTASSSSSESSPPSPTNGEALGSTR